MTRVEFVQEEIRNAYLQWKVKDPFNKLKKVDLNNALEHMVGLSLKTLNKYNSVGINSSKGFIVVNFRTGLKYLSFIFKDGFAHKRVHEGTESQKMSAHIANELGL